MNQYRGPLPRFGAEVEGAIAAIRTGARRVDRTLPGTGGRVSIVAYRVQNVIRLDIKGILSELGDGDGNEEGG